MVACQRGVRLRGPLRRWWLTTRQNPSAIRWQIPGATFQSREELKDFTRGSLGAFPDLVCTPHALLAEGDMVAAHWTLVDTHQGAWRSVPATGRRIELRGMNMFRLARGKIVEGWGAWDTVTMMR